MAETNPGYHAMATAVLTALRRRLHHLATGDGLKARLIRGGLGSAGIQAANRVLALALGIVLARTLGVEGYGIYAYAFAIMSLLMVVAEAGVPTLLMREVAASQARAEWGLLRGVLRRAGQFVALAAGTVSLVGLLVLWAVGDGLAPAMLYTTALMLLVLPLSAASKTVAQALIGLHHVVLGQAVDMLLRPLLVLVLVGAGFLLWSDLRQPQYAMAAQLFGAGTVLVAGLVVLRRLTPGEARTAPSSYRSREWLRSALPFTLIGGALVINNQTDIIMVGWFTTADEVGIYRVAVQGAMLVFFPLQISQAILAPYFAKYYGQNDSVSLKSLDRRSRYAIAAATSPVFLALAVFSDGLIDLIFGREFSSASLPLTILAAGFFLNTTCGASGLLMQMTSRENFTAKVLLCTSLLNFFGNLFLIPIFGSVGAAISTGFTTFAYQLILRYKANRLVGA